MSQTLGYYYLEKHMREYNYWPNPLGFRGLSPTVLILVNILWEIYPLITEIIDFKTNFITFLFHIKFILMTGLLLSFNIRMFWKQRRLLEIINLFSGFRQFSVSDKIEVIDKNIKKVSKMIRFAGFFIAYFISYYMLFEEKCVNFKNPKRCLILEYYVPCKLNQWGFTLIILFQIHGINVTMNVIFITISLFYYSMETLMVHIESLKEIIENMKLSRNKKRNFGSLRNVMMYQQQIFKMFQMANDFFNGFVVPAKLFGLICLTVATTEFALTKNLPTFFMIVLTFLGLFVSHAIGQRFTTAADSVPVAVYDLNWYEADVSTRKDILSLLCLSQRTLKVELPLVRELSHAAAANEFKRVFVFFTWLLKVTKEKNV